jgi:hypothetical protein
MHLHLRRWCWKRLHGSQTVALQMTLKPQTHNIGGQRLTHALPLYYEVVRLLIQVKGELLHLADRNGW